MNKIIYETSGEEQTIIRSISIEYSFDADIHEVAKVLNLLLIGIGYHPDTIKEVLVLEDE